MKKTWKSLPMVRVNETERNEIIVLFGMNRPIRSADFEAKMTWDRGVRISFELTAMDSGPILYWGSLRDY